MSIDKKARLIQKATAELGWEDNLEALLQRVNELDKGLVHEDEFLFLLGWTQKCKFFHKLDQSVILPDTKDTYKIPDVLAVFDIDGKPTPYLIEIKTSKKSSLSWSEKYYNGLLNYSKLLNVPLLVAWKWNTFDIWTLFDIHKFDKGPTNYKMSLEKSHKQSLMSKLLGDYFLVLQDDLAICIRFKKRSKQEEKGNVTTWNTVIDEVYFEGKGREKVEGLDPGLFSLMMGLSTEVETTENETHIINRYYPSPNKVAFIQSIPVTLARAMSGDKEVNWIERIENKRYPVAYDKLYKSLEEGINKKMIRNILHFQPNNDK